MRYPPPSGITLFQQLEMLEELPEKRKVEIARAVLEVVGTENHHYQLSDEQVAENVAFGASLRKDTVLRALLDCET